MQKKNNLMFVHVPRTGGTSIITHLYLPQAKRYPLLEHEPTRVPMYNSHDPVFVLNRLNDLKKFFKFSVIRNPFTRAYSNFKGFIYQNKISGVDLNHFTFKDFLMYVRTKGNALYSNAIYTRTPFCIFDQCFYITNDSGEIEIDRIYKFEKLFEFEDDFNIKMTNVNPSGYSKEEYLSAFTKENIGLAKSLYFRDFYELGYSTNFDDSI